MYEVTKTLYRGPRPKDLRLVAASGFQQIIVTQSGDEDRLTDSLYEAQLRSKRSDPSIYPTVDIVYIRCSNIFPPTNDQVSKFLAAMSTGKKTYIHCHSGVDRTGFLIAVYQMQKLGYTYEEAYEEWVEMGRHWWFDWWKHELKKYEKAA
jgi:protein tyrosine/serine phosphatase